MRLLIATGNEGKKKEILEFFETLSPRFEFLTLKDFPEIEEPEENGSTFEENALIKARYFGEAFEIPTISEDAGLVLDAFPEKFGLKTRREIEADTDEEWLEKFLFLLEGEVSRGAAFFSAMAFYDPQKKKEQVFMGKCEGVIIQQPEVGLEEGIPVSAVFQPEGADTVFSVMSKIEKNEISHRGKSARKMEMFLFQNFRDEIKTA
ncbi:non-canonical purine NTP pyrophosphatase [Candidatus Gracilibacteria bacterium]|nr:non-canonical purine NTP pyrophosphatase [Candidatus Gracilibacteria bacterium]